MHLVLRLIGVIDEHLFDVECKMPCVVLSERSCESSHGLHLPQGVIDDDLVPGV